MKLVFSQLNEKIVNVVKINIQFITFIMLKINKFKFMLCIFKGLVFNTSQF